MFAAAWMANCLRMSHRLSGVLIVLIMYWGSSVTDRSPFMHPMTHIGQDVLGDHLGLNLLHDLDLELDESMIILDSCQL